MTGEFRPPPLLGNSHVQTFLALWMKRGRLPGRTRRWRVPLPDGDALVLHDNTPSRWRSGGPVAVVVHGLTGSHRSAGVTLLADRIARRGIRVFRVDLRGAGASFRLCRKFYTAGCSEDLRAAVDAVARIAPGSPVAVVGTSLGGNVSLKLAADAANRPVEALTVVAAINPPVDLQACTDLIAHPRNRRYERHFVAELVRDVSRSAAYWRLPPPPVHPAMSLQEFDDAFTAPRNGYADAAEYYRLNSTHEAARRSPVPTLILTARDDPFVAVEPIAAMASDISVIISERGGHTGYVGFPVGWAESLIAEWVATRLDDKC